MKFYQKLMKKESFFYRKPLEVKYKYIADPGWSVNFGNTNGKDKVSVIPAKGKNKYHAIDQNGDKISFEWNPVDASPELKALNILMKIRKKRAKKLNKKEGS